MQQELLTARELAERLKVSVAAVRVWTRQGMPCIRLRGRLVRFDVTAWEWIQQRQQEGTRSVD
jgi:excisionase family DNA binding protein